MPLFFLIILSIVVVVGYNTGYFEEQQLTPSDLEQYIVEARLSLGLKEADIYYGGEICEIIEPVYASLTCVDVPFGGKVTLKPGLTQEDSRFNSIVTEVDYRLPPDVADHPLQVDGKAHKIDWERVKGQFDINEVSIFSDTEHLVIVASDGSESKNKVIYGWTGWAGFWSANAVDPEWEVGTDLPSWVDTLYVFRATERYFLWLGIQPVQANDWEMKIVFDDEYLTYSVPGVVDPYRLSGSFGCTPDAIKNLLRNERDVNTGMPLLEALGEDSDVIDDARDVQGETGIIDSDVQRSLSALYATISVDSTDVNVADKKLQRGEAVHWIHYYRNTGIVQGVKARAYDGEQVLCQQDTEKLIGFNKVPLSSYQEDRGLCYVLPSKIVLDAKTDRRYSNKIFSCSEEYCRTYGAARGVPAWDPDNFWCVSQDAIDEGVVQGNGCNGDAECGPTEPLAVPLKDGGAIITTGWCRPSSTAPAGYEGVCSTKEKTVECLPGEQTATRECDADGTWQNYVVLKKACPDDMCCKNSLLYYDNADEKNNGCPTGTTCCANFEEGDKTGNCQKSCESYDKIPPAENFIYDLKALFGIDDNSAKLLGLGFIAVIVFFGVIIILILIGKASAGTKFRRTINNAVPGILPGWEMPAGMDLYY